MHQRIEESMLLDTDFRERGGRVGISGITKADQGSDFSTGVYLFSALVQKLTTHEHCHLELYWDKFKRQVALVDIEEAEDSEMSRRWQLQN
jgi:hypothetical protein